VCHIPNTSLFGGPLQQHVIKSFHVGKSLKQSMRMCRCVGGLGNHLPARELLAEFLEDRTHKPFAHEPFSELKQFLQDLCRSIALRLAQ
jgi:hypothetical protein